MTKARLEAFSDGVFAIVITLLVLDLKVPAEIPHGGLLAALGRQWPSYFAYVVSFLVVGIIWVNHHALFEKLRGVDRLVLFANLALLFFVSVIPFPTRLVSEYLLRGDDAEIAVAIYSAVMVGMSIAIGWIWFHVTGDRGLLQAHLDRAAHRAAMSRFGVGSVTYLALVGLSFVTPIGTLAIHGLLALYYCFDQLRPASARGPAAGSGGGSPGRVAE